MIYLRGTTLLDDTGKQTAPVSSSSLSLLTGERNLSRSSLEAQGWVQTDSKDETSQPMDFALWT